MAGFIVFEGIDGSGKSTQSKLFLSYLLDRQKAAMWHCEPTNGVIGSIIRHAFTGKINLQHVTIANLFAADRYEHITAEDTGLLALLDKGDWVICDRYLLSSYAYQGSLLDLEWVQQINAKNEALLWPALTFYINLDPAIAMQRIEDNRDSTELFETQTQLIKVHATYEAAIDQLADWQKKTIIRINGHQSIEAIQEEIQHCFEQFINA